MSKPMLSGIPIITVLKIILCEFNNLVWREQNLSTIRFFPESFLNSKLDNLNASGMDKYIILGCPKKILANFLLSNQL